MGPKPRPGIEDIPLYQSGKAKLHGVNRPLKLSSNENPLGCSPAAKDAYLSLADHLALYPASDHAALTAAIGEVHDLDPARIALGAGSDEIISLLCNGYSGPGTEVLYSRHGFSMYPIYAQTAGATPVRAAEAARVVEPEAILAAVTDRTRIVFVANPNNPTGTLISPDAVQQIADGLPPEVLLVLDGAYAEYVTAAGYDAGEALAGSRQNVLMLRTFSKVHGLGALRVGWCYGPRPIIDTLNRMRGPFNISAPGLAAAEAAIRDRAFVAACVAQNTKLRAVMAAALADIGIPSDPSEANFLLARFQDADQAEAANAALQKAGIIVRGVASYDLPQALRITVGDAEACRRVIAALTEFMAGQGA